ncbi:MAG: hypothetical protein ACLTDM_11250 [Clostridium butyricum]
MKKTHKLRGYTTVLLTIFEMLCCFTTLATIACKLLGMITLSWLGCFTPLFICWVMNFLIVVVVAFKYKRER